MEKEQVAINTPKKSLSKNTATIIVVISVFVALFMVSATLFACYENWYLIFFICVIPWLILNYWFGKALVVLQQYHHSDYIKRARYILILVQLIVTVLGFIINIVAFNIWWNWPNVWRAAIPACVISSLVGFISAYIAIHNYPLTNPIKQHNESMGGQVASQQYLVVKNIPKRMYAKTNITTVIMVCIGVCIGTAIIMFWFISPAAGVIMSLIAFPVVVLWLFLLYHFGFIVAQRHYDDIINGRSRKIYLKILVTQLGLIIIMFCIVYIATNGKIPSAFLLSSPAEDNIFLLIPIFAIVSTCGFAFSYFAAHSYIGYVCKYHLPKPT